MTPTRFADRTDAGRVLAHALREYAGRSDTLVLALPRGGVPVAAEVARALDAPLDVFLVRKLGVPGHEELAFGAIAEDGTEVLHDDLVRSLGLSRAAIAQVAARERLQIDRHDARYRAGRRPPPVERRTVILIDDGLATGATMEAAVVALRARTPAQIVVAVPVGSREACDRLARLADRVVCPSMPEPFQAVGLWYRDFGQTSDDEVTRLLAGAGRTPAANNPHGPVDPVDVIRRRALPFDDSAARDDRLIEMLGQRRPARRSDARHPRVLPAARAHDAPVD